MLSLNRASVFPLAIGGKWNANSFGDLPHRESAIFSELSETLIEGHHDDLTFLYRATGF